MDILSKFETVGRRDLYAASKRASKNGLHALSTYLEAFAGKKYAIELDDENTGGFVVENEAIMETFKKDAMVECEITDDVFELVTTSSSKK